MTKAKSEWLANLGSDDICGFRLLVLGMTWIYVKASQVRVRQASIPYLVQAWFWRLTNGSYLYPSSG
jgi:hypothetical protein